MTLNVRQGISEANAAFVIAPGLFCTPLVSIGLFFWVLREAMLRLSPARASLWIEAPLSLVGLLAQLAGIVLVSAMYLRAREGTEPELVQVRDVLQFRGLWATVWRLLLRYMGWAIVVFLIAVLAVAVLFVLLTVMHLFPASKPGVKTPWPPMLAGFFTAGLMLMIVGTMSRYSFSLPLLAVFRGARENLVTKSEELARGVLGTLVVVCVLEAGPFAAFLMVSLYVRHHAVPLAVRLLVVVTRILSENCISTWFALLLTSLTLQRLGGVTDADELGGGVRE